MAPEDQEFISRYTQDLGLRKERIVAIGVGGGGGNAVNHMFRQGINQVAFYVANTDQQDLEKSPVPNKILLGPTVTRGRGSGNRPDRACQAAEESVEAIEDIFKADTDMVFITAGMGGGTGTGASPVIARVAREKHILTIGIVTIPFLFEGMSKIKKALEGADEMRKYTDALIVINNNRLSEIYPDLSFENAFEKADDILSTAAASISEIITTKGRINRDFNDVDTTLRDGKTAIISTGYGEGEHRVTKAIQDALNSPLLKNTDVYTSKRLLFNLYYNPNAEQKFLTAESNEFSDFVTKIVADVDVIWGLAHDESLGNKVKVTILAAGFDITVDDQNIIHGSNEPSSSPEVRKQKEIREMYGDAQVERILQQKQTQRYIILTPEQMDDDATLATLESTPAFNRDPSVVSNLFASGTIGLQQPAPKPEAKPGSGTLIEFNPDEF